MKTFKFKTNFKCQGCIDTVQPHLDKIEGVTKWKVINDKTYKILEVETDDKTDKQQIIDAIQAAGYDVVEIKPGIKGLFR